MYIDHEKLREKLKALAVAEELSAGEYRLIIESLYHETLKVDFDQLVRRIKTLRDAGKLDGSEFQYIEKKVSNFLVPWGTISSLLFSCLGIILLEANVAMLTPLFHISEGMAAIGLISGLIAFCRRERNQYIAIIGIFLSLFVLFSEV